MHRNHTYLVIGPWTLLVLLDRRAIRAVKCYRQMDLLCAITLCVYIVFSLASMWLKGLAIPCRLSDCC